MLFSIILLIILFNLVYFFSTTIFSLLGLVEDVMSFSIAFSEEFTSSFQKLDPSVKLIAGKRLKKIISAPFLGKPLSGTPYLFSERFLNYRIIYRVSGEKIVFVKLGKRDSVYRSF